MAHTWRLEITAEEARAHRAALAAGALAALLTEGRNNKPDSEVMQKLIVRSWEIADTAIRCGGYVTLEDMQIPGPGIFSELEGRLGLVTASNVPVSEQDRNSDSGERVERIQDGEASHRQDPD